MQTVTQKVDAAKILRILTWEWMNKIEDGKTFSLKDSDTIFKPYCLKVHNFLDYLDVQRIKLLQNDFLVVEIFSMLPK